MLYFVLGLFNEISKYEGARARVIFSYKRVRIKDNE